MALPCRPENTVVYKLFPALYKISNSSIKDDLERFAEIYVNKISGFLNRYIWQNDSFHLDIVETAAESHLEGSTCFEDNVEDEWFIVYLLFYLTSKDQNLIVQIQDEDGEFLLIEAADYLPTWLKPETSENRVFMYQGSLHIIPIARSPADVTPLPSGTPPLSSALSVVREFSSLTRAADSVQEILKNRIKGFPHKIDELKHRAHCYVPCAVAALLLEDPQLIAPAVKAFYLRTPLDMKACRAMKFFAPETSVMTEVLFTRCLYAQLSSQEYEPDKKTGWNKPNGNNVDAKAYKLGMKLACGFEILASSTPGQVVESATSNNHDFNNDLRWKRFLKSLKDKGYFRDHIEGTPLFQRLLYQAQNFYMSTLMRDKNDNVPLGVRVRKLLESVSVNYDEMKDAEKNLRPPDDDSWLNITPEVLDSMLEKMSRQPTEMAEKITGGLKTFLQKQSGLDGVEAPSNNQKNKKQKISFDADAFADSVNKILDFRIPESDDDGSSSSMSGYSDEEEENLALGEGAIKKDHFNGNTNDMEEYMEQMDRELAKTNIGLSFEKLPQTNKAPLAEEDIDSAEDDFQPVDVDLNALKNILESYSSQQGMPGPISNLFSSMGMEIPENADS